jgi:hypothetical protein
MVMNTGVADKVVEMRSKYPLMKAVEIAKQVTVSRERVRQILKKHGLPTKFVLSPNLCRYCGHLLDEGNKGRLCWDCRKKLQVTRICFRCGQEYQATLLGGKSKYCRDCRVVVQRKRVRLCVYRRKWEQQKKRSKHHCIFCQGIFDSAVEFSRHRVETGELRDPDFRKWVMTYRSTHSYWKTLDYFHISQETFKAIRDGKETTKHH